uniref:Tubulin binding cofactor C-like domain-containing protein n=1 Tax=Ditylenchus dipsaci TaxID=166011 RepID=A0A915CUE9_9BILA
MVNQLPKKRLVIWPKGSLLFNTNYSAVSLNLDEENEGNEDWDSITLAFRLLYYHFYNKRSRKISAEEWSRVAVSKMRFSPEFARIIFLTAQAILPLEGANKWTGAVDYDRDTMQNVKADLLPILAIISVIGCRTRSNGSSIVRYLRKHMERICLLLLLCHYDLSVQYISSQKYTPLLLNHLPIPAKALSQLDVLFEGTFLPSIPSSFTSTANIIPYTCSSLLYSIPELNFTKLVEIMCNSLQADMFLLDVEEKILQPIKSVRSITSTQFAEHRKISVRDWQHMELLTNMQYAGSNLRLMHAHHTISPVFHLRWLRSVAIVDCNDVGVVVLGPVQQMVVLKRVKKATVSVICPMIWVEQCEDVLLFVNCECAVMIMGEGCTGIQLAPYNVFYDGLVYELDKAKMQLKQWCENSFDKPLIINSVHSSKDRLSETTSLREKSAACWFILPTKHFYVQSTPFCETHHSSFYKTFLSSIPPKYQKEWFEVSRPLAVQSTLKQNSLSYEFNKQFLRDHMPFSNTDLSYLLRRVDRKI